MEAMVARTAAIPARSSGFARARRKYLATAIVLAAIATLGGIYAWRWSQPRNVSLQGEIVSIDPAARTGVLRIIHPKSGELFDLAGEIAPNCEIVVGHEPAAIAALSPGEQIHADGQLFRSGRMIATRLEVSAAAEAPDRSAVHQP